MSWLRPWNMGAVKPVGQLYGSPTALTSQYLPWDRYCTYAVQPPRVERRIFLEQIRPIVAPEPHEGDFVYYYYYYYYYYYFSIPLVTQQKLQYTKKRHIKILLYDIFRFVRYFELCANWEVGFLAKIPLTDLTFLSTKKVWQTEE